MPPKRNTRGAKRTRERADASGSDSDSDSSHDSVFDPDLPFGCECCEAPVARDHTEFCAVVGGAPGADACYSRKSARWRRFRQWRRTDPKAHAGKAKRGRKAAVDADNGSEAEDEDEGGTNERPGDGRAGVTKPGAANPKQGASHTPKGKGDPTPPTAATRTAVPHQWSAAWATAQLGQAVDSLSSLVTKLEAAAEPKDVWRKSGCFTAAGVVRSLHDVVQAGLDAPDAALPIDSLEWWSSLLTCVEQHLGLRSSVSADSDALFSPSAWALPSSGPLTAVWAALSSLKSAHLYQTSSSTGHATRDAGAGAGGGSGTFALRSDPAGTTMPGSLPTVEGDVGTVTTFRPAGAKRDVAVVKVPWQEAGLQLSKAFTECTTLPMPASGAYLLDWRWGLPESIVSDTEFRAQVTRQHYDLTRVINGKAALDLLGGSIPKVTSYLDGPVSAVSLETAWHKLRQAQIKFFGPRDPLVQHLNTLSSFIDQAVNDVEAAVQAKHLDAIAVRYSDALHRTFDRLHNTLSRRPSMQEFSDAIPRLDGIYASVVCGGSSAPSRTAGGGAAGAARGTAAPAPTKAAAADPPATHRQPKGANPPAGKAPAREAGGATPTPVATAGGGSAAATSLKACRLFAAGSCRFGDKCKYSHSTGST